MDVYLEIGKKRIFAVAIDWPGLCRSGKDEALAVQALLDYGPRYQQAIAAANLGFTPPENITAINILERLMGNAGTDFGAPVVSPSGDPRQVSQAELERFQALLGAIWQSFDSAVQLAEGKELRTGPRGGGRDLDKIVQHVLEAEKAYLSQLGSKFKPEAADPPQIFAPLRQAILTALEAAVRGELPTGGARWTPRFYVRYSAWHLLDHTWEIEDRIV